MPTATITSKGQITIPVQVREKLGLRTGDQIDFVTSPTGEIVLKPKRESFEKLRGLLKAPDRPPVTVEEMNQGIVSVMRQRWKQAQNRKARRS